MFDFVFLDDVALDATAALGAARRFGNRSCVDYLGGAEVEGGVVGEVGAGFCDFDVALVAALGVDLLDGLAHCVAGIRCGCDDKWNIEAFRLFKGSVDGRGVGGKY